MTAAFEPPAGQGYDLQQVYAEAKKDFWFRWADRWWRLPNLHMLDFELQSKVMGFGALTDGLGAADTSELAGHVNTLFDLIMESGREGQAAEWRETVRPIAMLLKLLNQWTEGSGAVEGESSASAGSSKSTGRPSKRTSTRSTGSASRKRSTTQTGSAGSPPGNS